ncbi:MAG: hypothetical protein KGJ30_18900, partial [Burkholderiales bacterium]|nr:hypothetical protein [Burkholderiales bacterium]
MLRKLLGLFFNRWTLWALLLAALLVLLWWVGPEVQIRGWRPLGTDRACWIATALLVLALAGSAGWRAWRARRGNEQVVAALAPAAPAA